MNVPGPCCATKIIDVRARLFEASRRFDKSLAQDEKPPSEQRPQRLSVHESINLLFDGRLFSLFIKHVQMPGDEWYAHQKQTRNRNEDGSRFRIHGALEVPAVLNGCFLLWEASFRGDFFHLFWLPTEFSGIKKIFFKRFLKKILFSVL